MIEVFNQHPTKRFSKKETIRTIEAVLKGEKIRKNFSISVVFVDNKFIRKINKKYLNHDYPTDVISFSLGKADWSVPIDDRNEISTRLSSGRTEGELHLSLDKARTKAKEYNVTIANEVQRLLIHGTLHLLGYDDKGKDERNIMKRLEESYLRQLTI